MMKEHMSLTNYCTGKSNSSYICIRENGRQSKNLRSKRNSSNEDEDEKEYNVRQLKLMSNSQFNAITVAFNRAN